MSKLEHRCLAPDFERYARSVAAFLRLAMIRIMPDAYHS